MPTSTPQIVTRLVQLGESANPADNFFLRAEGDGTVSIARCSDGRVAALIGADNKLTFPGNVVPSFCYRMTSGSLGFAAGTFTKVPLTVKDHDLDADVVSSRYTAKISGVYHFDAIVRMSGTGVNTASVIIRKNGADFVSSQSGSDAGTYAEPAVSASFFLNAGEYVELWAYNATAGAIYGSAGAHSCMFSGYLERAA